MIFSSAWFFPPQASAQLQLLGTGSLVVTITSPTSGSTVSGTITVSASVSPLGALVEGVQFKLDGAALGAEDTTAPYSVPWDTTATMNGSHILTAVARDALGLRFTSDPVTVTVANADTTPPTVAITSPASGSTVSGTIAVSASASDNRGVAGVQFFADGTAIGVEDTTAPYSVVWDTTTVADGSHTLTAVARDAAGNTTTSAPVTVTVSNALPADTTSPTVTITSPAAGTTVSGTITVTAEASDNVQVEWVQLSVDGVIVSAQDTTAPYEFSWDTTTVADGSHTLTAEAQDRSGNSTVSSPVTVTVANTAPSPSDTTPPSVAITSPADGSTVAGTITVSADATDAGGVDVVQFLVDGIQLGDLDSTAPYEAVWDTTTATDGSHTLQARARDTAGNIGESAVMTVTVSNEAAPPPGESSRIEETDPAITYTGFWQMGRGAELAEFSGGTATNSQEIGATATLTFSGTGVSWWGWHCEICGIAQVTLDGAVVAEVDTFAPTRDATSVVVFSASGLSDGSHTLAIEILEKLNPSSGNRHIVVDAFDVTSSSSSTTTTSFATVLSLDATRPQPEIDPILLEVLETADPDQLIEGVVTFDHDPTPIDHIALEATGVEILPFQVLPMIGVRGTATQIFNLFNVPGILSLYYNDRLSYFLNESVPLVGADRVWNDLGYTGKGVTIAVIDTGIDGTHPDLPFGEGEKVVQNVKVGPELFGSDPIILENLADTDTTSGHGTHVASIAAGTGAALEGKYRGVAIDAKLVGVGAGEALFVLTALQSFDWVLANRERYGIRVISNSWGTQGSFSPDHPVNMAGKMAHDDGLVVVFAAGNDGPEINTLNPFCVAPWVICVAAGEKDGRTPADFSSRGVPGDLLLHPTITAPGVNIAAARATTGIVVNTFFAVDFINIGTDAIHYAVASGTSMATPHVSGTVALMLEANPLLTPDEVKVLLEETATPMPEFDPYEVGAGYLNAFEAVRAVPAPTRIPVLSFSRARPTSREE